MSHFSNGEPHSETEVLNRISVTEPGNFASYWLNSPTKYEVIMQLFVIPK
jgi:hypothetical protein